MGMQGSRGSGPQGPLCEINVTPLVDVMLVLLIIFMVAAGVQTLEMDQDQQDMVERAERILEEAEALQDKKAEAQHTKVNIELPRLDSQAVNLAEEKKLKLVIDADLNFRIDERVLVDCRALSPGITLARGGGEEGFRAQDEALRPCLKRLGEKLVDNDRLKRDQELYLLADRRLDYGIVLKTMAVIRQAGVTKFGLVAAPELLEGARTAPTPRDIQ